MVERQLALEPIPWAWSAQLVKLVTSQKELIFYNDLWCLGNEHLHNDRYENCVLGFRRRNFGSLLVPQLLRYQIGQTSVITFTQAIGGTGRRWWTPVVSWAGTLPITSMSVQIIYCVTEGEEEALRYLEGICHFYAKWWKHECKGWDEEKPEKHGELDNKNVWGLTLVKSQPNIFSVGGNFSKVQK